MLTGSMASLVAALLAFVGTHFLLSHALRAPIVRSIGEGPFRGVYSLVAAATFVWVVFAYSAAPYVAWWPQLEVLRWPVNIVMICACILVVGGFLAPNPFVQSMGPGLDETPEIRGVFAVTRHPLMWGIGLWAFSHAAINGDARTILLASGMAVLALAGAVLQDRKLARRLGPPWGGFEARTSFIPFAAILTGKTKWRDIGGMPLVAGIGLYVILVGGHLHYIGVQALPHF